MLHSSVSTGCVLAVFALDYLLDRRKPTGSDVVGGSNVIPTRICPVDFVQTESQQGKRRQLEPSRPTSSMPMETDHLSSPWGAA